jgi:hypothetical protein
LLISTLFNLPIGESIHPVHIFFGGTEPDNQIYQATATTYQQQNKENDSDNGGIYIQILGEAATHTGNLAVGATSCQSFIICHNFNFSAKLHKILLLPQLPHVFFTIYFGVTISRRHIHRSGANPINAANTPRIHHFPRVRCSFLAPYPGLPSPADLRSAQWQHTNVAAKERGIKRKKSCGNHANLHIYELAH